MSDNVSIDYSGWSSSQPKTPPTPDEVLLFSPDWSESWWIGWHDPRTGKWWVDPKDEPCRCLTDEGCKVEVWVPLPPIPEPWKTRWEKNPY